MSLFFHLLIPLGFIALALLIKRSVVKRRLAIIFAGANLLMALFNLQLVNSGGIIVTQAGGWDAPHGITLVADRFSAFMLLLAGLVFLVLTIYSYQAIDKERQKNGHFFYTFGILMGVNGSFIAGDLFNLYVWYEVMLMSSFVLIGLGGEKQQMEGTIKYLILNFISALFFLSGVGLLYGVLGSLNMADISRHISTNPEVITRLNPALTLIFVSFAIKGALVPFFFWLPASYHTPPPATTALFAGLLTKVGIYSLIRFHTLFLYHNAHFWNTMLLAVGTLSMVIGVIAASSRYDFRKILSFHIISQMGYAVIALGFYSVAGITAAIFFLGHNMLSKTNAFLVAGWVHRQNGTLNLQNLGDMLRQNPWWGAIFFISAFSLSGLPPLSGFVAKYLVIKAGVEANQLVISLIALAVGLFTLFSMLKIWLEVFWKPQPERELHEPAVNIPGSKMLLYSSGFMAFMIVLTGIYSYPIIKFCEAAANDLLNTAHYIHAVLGYE